MSGSNKPGNLVLKDPSSANDPYGVDWTDYLDQLGTGVQISTSTWSFAGFDLLLTIASSEILTGNLVTQVYLSGGTVGKKYVVTNRIVTNSTPAVTDDRSFTVLVQNR